MKGFSLAFKTLLVALLVHWAVATPAMAQQKPVMENVFFNVVWGSALGAVLGISTAVIGSDDHSAPSEARSSAFTGATVGGLAGLGMGLYLIFQGITFEPAGSTFVGDVSPTQGRPVSLPDPPFVLTASRGGVGFDGFRARVFEFKF